MLLVFFMNQFPPSPRVSHYDRFEFFRKFAEILKSRYTTSIKIGFKKLKKHRSSMACVLGLIVPLLPLGPSCPLQTILLRDLVGCGSPLQIVMAVWCSFFRFEARQTAITVCSRYPHPTKQVQIFLKVRQTAITICSGLLYPTGWAAQPSEDISQNRETL